MGENASVPVFILAGGLGTRLSEETQAKPKPMVEIGGIPLLVHIMRSYYRYGFNDFVICAGYRSWDIKNYFLNYEFRKNHLAIDHREGPGNAAKLYGSSIEQEKWRVRVVDTGVDSMTGARVARAFDIAYRDEPFSDFALTYGDGVSNVDLAKELEFHRQHGKIGTVLGVGMAQGRFGVMEVVEGTVAGFVEKPDARKDTINGGFFFFKEAFREFVSPNPSCILEREPLEKLTANRQLMSFRHRGFWYPMDTLRDKNHLEDLWHSGSPPWLV